MKSFEIVFDDNFEPDMKLLEAFCKFGEDNGVKQMKLRKLLFIGL